MFAPFRALVRLVPASLLVLFLGAGCGMIMPTSDEEPSPPPDDSLAQAEVPRTVQREAEREAMPAGVDLDTVRARRFDQGKMWTFENPPVNYFQETYDFNPDAAWFQEAQRGALRLPGCSASFVSPHGLVLTNHHCAREHVAQVSRLGENLIENGFYAEALGQERRAPDMHADQLIAIEDVTEEVRAALKNAQTDAERAQARQEVFTQIEERLQQSAEAENVRVEVVSLYHGGRYSAYTYRRYDDVRLVMAPELQLGYFGGDPDNFTYPRFALDMALFRVYDENGEPLEPAHYFAWDEDGAEEGEPVFIVGNPGSTSRLETVTQLKFRRDVQDQATHAFVTSRAEVLETYRAAHPEEAESYDVRNKAFSLRNAEKLYTGRLKALRDPVIMARRRDAQERFREAIQADSSLRRQYSGLFEQMAELQQEKRDFSAEYGAFLSLRPGSPYASATLRRALLAYRYLRQQEQGAANEQLAKLREQIVGVETQPDELDRRLIEQRIGDFQTYFGEDSDLVQQLLGGRSPEQVAQSVATESVLADSASAVQAIREGTLSMSDPALQFTDAYFSRYRDYQSGLAGLRQQEQELAGELGRARFAIYGTQVPPDATFSPRIADGRVQGYEYNGTRTASHTAFFGLYDHYYAYGAGTPWDLPERWLSPPDTFDRSTALNLVSTNDITGGNSGSPLVDRDLDLVGVVFDGNIESLASDFIYLPRRARAVSVDVRGMREALDVMYDADRLVLELMEGRLAETEAQADALSP